MKRENSAETALLVPFEALTLEDTLQVILIHANDGTELRRNSTVLMCVSRFFKRCLSLSITTIRYFSLMPGPVFASYPNTTTLGLFSEMSPMDLTDVLPRLDTLIMKTCVTPQISKYSQHWSKHHDALLQSITGLTSLHALGPCLTLSTKTMLYLQTRLKSLSLSDDRISAEADTALLTRLESLSLVRCCGVRDHTLSRLTGLTALSVRDNGDITDQSVSRLTNLKTLSLEHYVRITDSSVSALTSLTRLEKARVYVDIQAL